MKTKSVICGIICFFILCFSAHAESKSDDKWHFHIAPYVWLAGQKGTVATLPGLPPADIDVDFSDILDDLEFAGMLVGEVRKGRFGLFMDILYTDVEGEDPTPLGIFYSSVSVRTTSWNLSAAALYRLAERQSWFLDVIGGFRYWHIDSELKLKGAAFPAVFPEQSVSHSEDWIDPLIGLKGMSSLGNSKFFVNGGFAIGGFGVGSEFLWDAQAYIGYRWTKLFAISLGYRYLDVDYDNDGFLYDVAQYGPILGLSFRF
jgi:hypothetical protein